MFRWLELVTGGLLIPLVAILIALFTGWCLTRHLSGTMLGAAPKLFAGIWFWVMRLVLPLVVAWIGGPIHGLFTGQPVQQRQCCGLVRAACCHAL